MRSRWSNPVPPRDWRSYGLCYAVHFLTGMIAGAGVGYAIGGVVAHQSPYLLAPALTQLLAFRTDWRQTVEFLRRFDTPGRDMGDSIAGYCFGLLGGMAAGALTGGMLGM